MIANFFNKTKPINFIIIYVSMAILFAIALIPILQKDFSFTILLKKSILLILSIAAIFIINFIIRKNNLTSNNAYALLIFTMLFGFYPTSFFNTSIFFSNLILLFAFRRIYSLRSQADSREKIFDSAFWIGVACLFYFWSAIFILLLYTAIWIFNKRDWRNLFTPIIGVITPIFLFYTYTLLVNNSILFDQTLTISHKISFNHYAFAQYLLPTLLLAIITIISIFPTTNKALVSKIDFKSTWIVLTMHILLATLIVLISPTKDGAEFLFLFFPLGILIANYIQYIDKYWIKETLFYLFISVIIIIQFL